MHSFEVHSNESACRKSGRLGLEQVISNIVVAHSFNVLDDYDQSLLKKDNFSSNKFC